MVPGVGYPSCSRALARIPPNTNDPNGYYAELGLPPWADRAEVRRVLRRRMREYHPDGTHPDTDKFARYAEISETLLDPDRKSAYENLEPGMVLVDSQVRQRADEAKVPIDCVDVSTESESTVGTHYDWFSKNPCRYDGSVAQRWYRSLLAVAPAFGYTRTIRILLHDEAPQWLGGADILMVPRSWTPDTGSAYALFTVLVGQQH